MEGVFEQDNRQFLFVDVYGRLVIVDMKNCLINSCVGFTILDEYIYSVDEIIWCISDQEKVTKKYINLMFGLF